MAQRRTARKPPTKKAGRIPFSTVFWLAFLIALISIFLIFGLPVVKKGIAPSRPAPQEQAAQEPSIQEPGSQKPAAEKPSTKPPAAQENPPAETARERPPRERPSGERPRERPSPQSETPQPARQPEKPPSTQPAKPPEQPPAKPLEQRQPPETRERSVYFMREGGSDLTLAKVTRKLAVSDSPLIDCVNAVLAGPTAEEKNRGIVSFIPPNTRLLSARVVNNTVHLNFNESFRYNTSGREGSAAQLQQIVWTATEFPNVNNVQIEIEGKIVDFLVEGIAIRNPIGR